MHTNDPHPERPDDTDRPGQPPGAGEPSLGQTVTACVIVRDEQRTLSRCLNSLRFCGEVLVVDSGSRDATVQIARAAGAVVVENPWPGFAAQRNVAIDHAGGDWILEIDADEWLSPTLAAEIGAFLENPPPEVSIAVLPMRQHFLGAALGPSAHYPFYRPRLFRRGAYRHDVGRAVHEGLRVRTRPWVFHNDMFHELALGWGEALADAWTYARLEAGQLGDVPSSAYMTGGLLRPPAKFFYQLVLLGGWRDGWRGAAKIGLDSLTDVIVWLRHLAGRLRAQTQLGAPKHAKGNHNVGTHAESLPDGEVSEHGEQGASGWVTAAGTERQAPPHPRTGSPNRRVHYGRRVDRVGLVRLALICSARSLVSAPVVQWLSEAERAGAWVTVISDAGEAPAGVRMHRVRRFGPLVLMRALDAERQLGPLDGVVTSGRWLGLLSRLLPSALRSYSPVLGLDESAAKLKDGH